MPRKKKVTKRRSSSRNVKTRRSATKRVSKIVSTKRVVASKRKMSLVLTNLVLFVVLFLISMLLYNVFSDEILLSFFFITTVITGLIAVAFLISYLVLVFMKWFGK